MFAPQIVPRILEEAVASGVSSAVRRTLTSPQGLSYDSVFQMRSVFAPGSGPVDYLCAAIVFLSIPGTIIGNILLYMTLNKRGRESLVGTPFANDAVEKGFTLSQIASSIAHSARRLMGMGSRGSNEPHTVTESDFTNSNGFTVSGFTTNSGKGPVLPFAESRHPSEITAPAPAKISWQTDKVLPSIPASVR